MKKLIGCQSVLRFLATHAPVTLESLCDQVACNPQRAARLDVGDASYRDKGLVPDAQLALFVILNPFANRVLEAGVWKSIDTFLASDRVVYLVDYLPSGGPSQQVWLYRLTYLEAGDLSYVLFIDESTSEKSVALPHAPVALPT